MGDHSETIQIDYDPTRISYNQLLSIFWNSHDPTSRAWSRQYMPAIFYHNDEQRQLALETKVVEERRRNTKIRTEIVPFDGFYMAEDYHQKYELRRNTELMREFKAMYPRSVDFVNSTAAARVNGYLGGYGTAAEIRAAIESLGLSQAGQERLLTISNSRRN